MASLFVLGALESASALLLIYVFTTLVFAFSILSFRQQVPCRRQ